MKTGEYVPKLGQRSTGDGPTRSDTGLTHRMLILWHLRTCTYSGISGTYLAPDLAHGAVARLLGQGEAGCWLYSGRLPQDLVNRRYGVGGADGVFDRHVEVGEEAGVDLAVGRQAQPGAPRAERL